jgi:CBS domain containing-hemolysin-like protein
MMFKLFLVIFLVFLNGFFVAAEFAMVKARGSKIEALASKGNLRARLARNMTDNLDAYLSACQLGITLASLGLGWIGEPAIAKLIEPALSGLGMNETLIHTTAFIIGFSIITILHIVLGELAPKTIAIRKSENVTMWTAAPMIGFYKLMYPFIWLLNGTANKLLKMIGIEPASEHDSAHTEEEIRLLLNESHKSGLIDNTELMLVDNVFEFAETNAREIMVPRTDMVCLYANLPYAENYRIAAEEMHTRYPLCETDKDNIIGFIHIKDLMKNPDGVDDIRELARPITTVPESIPISNLLKMMQKNRTHVALLIDEYGGTSGLVTIEDILEEIVGEIQDEFDEERPPIEQLEPGTYSVDGKLLIDDLNEQFGLDMDTDNYDTIAGWLYARIETPPYKGQCVEYGPYAFVVEEVDQMRITRLLIRVPDDGTQVAQTGT